MTEANDKMEVFSVDKGKMVATEKVNLSKDEWRERLDSDEFHVLREQGTERAFTGPNWDNKENGIYTCAGCGLDLFSSETKFDSGTGWPSYYEPISDANVEDIEDRSFFMRRTETVCARCGGHLGHVFTDGPQPTGLRYCMNGTALKFDTR